MSFTKTILNESLFQHHKSHVWPKNFKKKKCIFLASLALYSQAQHTYIPFLSKLARKNKMTKIPPLNIYNEDKRFLYLHL